MKSKGKYSAEYIIKNKDQIIKERKKRIRRKRCVIILVVLLCILCTLAVKLPYFNVIDVTLSGNKNLSIKQASDIYKEFLGENIFLFRKNILIERLKNNQYVEDIKVSRVFPNKIQISVTERSASYFVREDKCYIMDSGGFILEKLEELNNKSLIEVTGLQSNEFTETNVGLTERQKKVLVEFDKLCKANKSKIKFQKIDIEAHTDIKVFFGTLTIKLGTEYNMKDKLNKAINIIESHGISSKTGYIDVSFDGSAVVNVE